ncbi:MAG: AarF/ABC1/UbiB kinase family protein [Nannocystaceae bacterium]|nr:AarF/ABC1/UbiB kinase family protein [Nannocystaceae bacterium]
MSDEREVPTGRLARLGRLVGVGARTGASLLLSRDGKGAAEHAAAVLGSLRGLAAKVGQMASYVDGMVPDEHRESYERALGALLSAAPKSSPAAIRGVVERELGASIDTLFTRWDDAPLASASIGQVHVAQLHDGREVAVKVQHPGIDRAIEADLRNAGLLEGLVGAIGPKALNTKEVFAVISQRFREELDYELEADRQERFIEIHAEDAAVRIPKVVRERSSKRVLTTELARGRTIDEAATGPLERRRAHAEVLWRFVFRGNLVGAMFNADPHPGNYLFHDDGTVTFLDFGCVQPLVDPELGHARAAHRAALRSDESGFRRAIAGMLGTRGGDFEHAVVEYVRRCFEPLFGSPFTIDRRYAAEVVRGFQDMRQFAMRRDKSFTGMPPALVFMNRLQFGFYSVLARFDVAVDYAALEREVLGRAGLL